MSKHLSFIAVIFFGFTIFPSFSSAGGTGYPTYRGGGGHCADSKFSTPRYNQLLPYRHYEDRRRYNAAPCSGETLRTHPYLLKTVVVNKKYLPHYTYDQNGNRRCRRILTVTYKELYSDGSCYVWTVQG